MAEVHSVMAAARRQHQRWWRRTAQRRQRGGCSADGGGLSYGGRRQFVGDVAVVRMMALGSGVCTIKINVWLFVSKRIFLPRELPVLVFFCPRICPWLPPKPITNKKNPGRFARGQKKRFPFYFLFSLPLMCGVVFCLYQMLRM